MTENILQMANEEFAELNEQDARALTDQIKDSANTLWSLISIAHDRKAYKALGYATWVEYVGEELNIGKSRAYQILDQAKVIKEIGSASGLSTMVDISERDARDLKPILTQVTDRIREEVQNAPPEQIEQVVEAIIREERAAVQKAAAVVQGREALQELATDLGWKADPAACKKADAVANVMYALFNALQEIADLPEPDTLATNLLPSERRYVDMIPGVVQWLNKFAEVAR